MKEVNITSMNVNAYGRQSTITFGRSVQKGIRAQSKKTQGFGEDNGDQNTFLGPKGYVDDQDTVDSHGQNDT